MERKNLWAPWRIGYIQGLSKEPNLAGGNKTQASKDDGCFICHNLKHPEDDDKNLVLWRTDHNMVILNRYPYNNGHLLVAPNRHIPDLNGAAIKGLKKILQVKELTCSIPGMTTVDEVENNVKASYDRHKKLTQAERDEVEALAKASLESLPFDYRWIAQQIYV